LHPGSVTARFNVLLKDADLPPVTLHGLRHGAASRMLAAGVDQKVVQEILGHSMLSLTADTYTSVYPEVAADAAEAAAVVVPRGSRPRQLDTSHVTRVAVSMDLRARPLSAPPCRDF
jgi:integrase